MNYKALIPIFCVYLITISIIFSVYANNDLVEQKIDNFSCDIEIGLVDVTYFGKFFAKHPDQGLIFIYWKEPLSGISGVPLSLGTVFLIKNRKFTSYDLLSSNNITKKIKSPEEPESVEQPKYPAFDIVQMQQTSLFDSMLRNILMIDIDKYSQDEYFDTKENCQVIEYQGKKVSFFGHKISNIKCWKKDGQLYKAKYFDSDGNSVCKLKVEDTLELSNGKIVPGRISMSIVEGMIMVHGSSISTTSYEDGVFREKIVGDEIPYPSGGIIIKRDFKIIDGKYWVLSKVEAQKRNSTEQILRLNLSNYRINRGISNELFDEERIIEGTTMLKYVPMQDRKRKYLEAQLLFYNLKRKHNVKKQEYDKVINILKNISEIVDNLSIKSYVLYMWYQCLLEQGNYKEAAEFMLSYLDWSINSGFGYLSAFCEASDVAERYIEDGHISLAEPFLDKSVEYRIESFKESSPLELSANPDYEAKEYFRMGQYLHAIKFFEYVYKHEDYELKRALAKYNIARCYDMIARESITSSSWYNKDEEKLKAIDKAVIEYTKVVEKYPKTQIAKWASHNAKFLKEYYSKKISTTAENVSSSTSERDKEKIISQANRIISDMDKILHIYTGWSRKQRNIYTQSLKTIFIENMHAPLSSEEYNEFLRCYKEYSDTVLPKEFESNDSFAIEISSMRWLIKRYLTRRTKKIDPELKSELEWQIFQLTEQFDRMVSNYLYEDSLKNEIAQTKKEYRKMIHGVKDNVLYPILKEPLTPEEMFEYDESIQRYEKRVSRNLNRFSRLNDLSDEVAVSFILDDKKRELDYIVEHFISALARSQGTETFPDEFHPEWVRGPQYHYLPHRGIKVTVLVDRIDYPKLGIHE